MKLVDGEYEPNFKVGKNTNILYTDYTTSESIAINFTSPLYYTGTIDEFKEYYHQLVSIMTELFGKTHSAHVKEEKISWSTYFWETEKGTSPYELTGGVTVEWLFDRPRIVVSFSSKKRV